MIKEQRYLGAEGEINGAYIINGFSTDPITGEERVDCSYEYPIGTLYDNDNHQLSKAGMQKDIDTERLILNI